MLGALIGHIAQKHSALFWYVEAPLLLEIVPLDDKKVT